MTKLDNRGTRNNFAVLDDVCDLADEEYVAIIEEGYDNLARSLIESSDEIRELRSLLARAYDQLLLLGYNSGFTNEEIHKLANDIEKYLKETK